MTGCGWSVKYRRGRRCRIQDTGEFLGEAARRLPKTCAARVSSQWACAILFCSKRTVLLLILLRWRFMRERKYLQDIECVYCHQIYHHKVLSGGRNLGHQSGRMILPDLIKKQKLRLVSFPNLGSKQLLFIFLSIFRGDNEKPDDSLDKVTMNCLRFYDAICRNDRTQWSQKLLYFLFNLLSSQIKDIEKEHVNDNESDTQKDKTKEVKDKDKAASVSMSQYRACLRWNIERQIVPIHDTEMRFFWI